jgi:hypothetical protein
MDADSELITAVSTPPANQDEAANAAHLVKQEQQAQGNRVEALSIDGIGFAGKVLRELKDPNGLGLVVYVPPRDWTPTAPAFFAASDFHLTDDGLTLVCPAEEETQSRYRNGQDTTWHYQFKLHQCRACPLLGKCMENPPAKRGRQVNKNDYDAEYQAARALAQTEAYTQARQIHPKIERKLAEIIRYHAGRGDDLRFGHSSRRKFRQKIFSARQRAFLSRPTGKFYLVQQPFKQVSGLGAKEPFSSR